MSQCPCGSNKPFKNCCIPFLDRKKYAKTPEQLMRSRFTAFALGGYGQYLYASWHPSMIMNDKAVNLNHKSTDRNRLESLTKSQKGHQGWVEFNAWWRCQVGKHTSTDISPICTT